MLPAELDAAVAAWGWPRFRGKQLREWVYLKRVADPARMTNLSHRERAELGKLVRFSEAILARQQSSADGTRKLLLAWPEGVLPLSESKFEPTADSGISVVQPLKILAASGESAAAISAMSAETVMIPDGDRRTACVSSQVGCPVGCTFCASGLAGVKGNLSAAQIVEQVFRLNVLLADETAGPRPAPIAGAAPDRGERIDGVTLTKATAAARADRITNVVFMGMGEPLANYANVMQAVRILHDPECFNIGARRITISTVGVPPRMRQLAEEELPINLAISLHAPNEPLRKQLIPWAEHFALDDILDAARYYFDRTGREITLEYILLSGVNDLPEHARQLARLCKTLRANVNLIRYNEVARLPYQRPSAERVLGFQDILRNNAVNAHVRKSRGRDIDAACGQLRRKAQAGVATA